MSRNEMKLLRREHLKQLHLNQKYAWTFGGTQSDMTNPWPPVREDGSEKRSMIRKRIVFTGCVQGVGFRWRAKQAANLYGCTGWCRNDWDGSVTMEIQGSEEAIDKVIQSVKDGRYVWIQNMDVTPLYPEPDERIFRTD